ncbi:MAG TPA: helix-turn-helix domain-containing protein [Fimbriimonadaceae bacterium]|nr:helix-turn-helix domain-containing protein [Fimbriimonadaceae bacterium]
MRTKLSRNELIAHPVRLSILGALAGRELTAEQLGQILDDIPRPSLYRHIALLVEGGQIQVVSELRRRGRSTRLLALSDGAGRLDRSAIDPEDVDENRHLVDTFFARQMAGYANAIRDPSISPGDWRLLGTVLTLSEEEERELLSGLQVLIESFDDRPASGRRRRTLIFGSLPNRDLPTQTQE